VNASEIEKQGGKPDYVNWQPKQVFFRIESEDKCAISIRYVFPSMMVKPKQSKEIDPTKAVNDLTTKI
jgi:hypothetical protein